MQVQFLKSIKETSKNEWNGVVNSDYPFLQYDFLEILESSKCVSKETGWNPYHLIVKENEELIAVMPLYIKTDSQGEFIFDWSWADAYYRNGLDYYPKLVCSIPFTPATGPRLCIKHKEKKKEVTNFINSSIITLSEDLGFSSAHILLPDKSELPYLIESGFNLRTSSSFHWFNNLYETFDDFLSDLTSRQRKNIKKEREKIASQGVRLDRIIGAEITEKMLESFYNFYQVTYLKRGMQGYLNLEFFKKIVLAMPESLLLVLAYDNEGQCVAGALNFYDSKKLYGRYWGCLEEYDSLHFETCYYQGVEFCIKNALSSFDPGVQGEHKIKRGFLPIETYSVHWIKDSRFREAINDFIKKEAINIKNYNRQCEAMLPFKQEVTNKLYERNKNFK
jgi:predicted N-acyltransferase